MTSSLLRPPFAVQSLSAWKAVMFKGVILFALLAAGFGASLTHADATFTYELDGSDTEKMVKKFSISKFFVRIDDSAKANHFLLFQAGKFFPLYAVDEAQSRYTLLTPPVSPRLGPVSRSKPVPKTKSEASDKQAAQETSDKTMRPSTSPEKKEESQNKPAAEAAPELTKQEVPKVEPTDTASPASSVQPAERWPTPTLKPTKKKLTVAGIRCRVVHELDEGKPVKEHCMANSAALGVTKREVITLARLFGMARKKQFNWLGVGTKDEEFISVQSRDLRDDSMLQLTAVSTKPLPAGYLRIPRTFKKVDSEAKGDAESAAAKPE